MCGIIGVLSDEHVNTIVYDGLSMLQHRGQDAAGIATLYGGKIHLHKGNGMLSNVFNMEILAGLLGRVGIGHLRYPTAGSVSAMESQPFYVNHPYGIVLAHNGNLTNVDEIESHMYKVDRRHVNTTSDTELLLNIFAYGISQNAPEKPSPEAVFSGVESVNKICRGSYACTAIVAGLGLVGFRDPYGIRPLCLGHRKVDGADEYMLASESVSLDITGFNLVRDIKPGEAIVIAEDGTITTRICAKKTDLYSCLFEFIYFARPDSIIDGVLVHNYRKEVGRSLARQISPQLHEMEIDVVIPIPETGRISAIEMANEMKIEYREGFIKNYYVGRTFIMPTAQSRTNSIRRKLNPIKSEFEGKNIILVDDSIVRGNTSKNIIDMVRGLGANKIYIASTSAPVRFPNVYGIDMPTKDELIASGKSIDEISEAIGVDGVIFLELEAMKDVVRKLNPSIKNFEDSVFTGNYITGDVDELYLEKIAKNRKIANLTKLKTKEFIAQNIIESANVFVDKTVADFENRGLINRFSLKDMIKKNVIPIKKILGFTAREKP